MVPVSDTDVVPNPKPNKTRKRKQGEHLSQQEREILEQKIQEAVLNGEPSRIAWTRLRIHRDTFYEYVHRLQESTMKERIKDTTAILHSYVERKERIMNRLESMYAKKPNPYLLVLISRIEDDKFDRLQSAGFLPNAKREFSGEIEHSGALVEFIWGKKEKKQ